MAAEGWMLRFLIRGEKDSNPEAGAQETALSVKLLKIGIIVFQKQK